MRLRGVGANIFTRMMKGVRGREREEKQKVRERERESKRKRTESLRANGCRSQRGVGLGRLFALHFAQPAPHPVAFFCHSTSVVLDGNAAPPPHQHLKECAQHGMRQQPDRFKGGVRQTAIGGTLPTASPLSA